MLVKVVKSLPQNIELEVIDGYRPAEIQRKMFYAGIKIWQKRHPQWSKDKVRVQLQKYLANPESYTYHSTGGVVDVTLYDEKGQLEMGKDRHTYSKRINGTAKKNRIMLINAMENAGFVNYPLEWWHWCYGESLWAHVKGKKHAIYGTIPLKDLKKFL